MRSLVGGPSVLTAPSAGVQTRETGPVLLVFPADRPIGQGLDLALAVAEERETDLAIVRPVTLPRQTSLEVDDPSLLNPHRDALHAVLDEARGGGVDVQGTVRLGHDVSAVVVEEVTDRDADLVLAPGRPPLGTTGGVSKGTVEKVMDSLGCRVVVYGEPPAPTDPDRVGMAVAGGPHTEGMLALAPVLVGAWDASVVLLHVLHPDADGGARREAQALLDETADSLPDDALDGKHLVEEEDVIATVLKEARPTDAWILGAPTRSGWKHLLYGSRARKVQRDAPSWTFVVHEPDG
jgi:nucleotide-binding universal stress UspA family protein